MRHTKTATEFLVTIGTMLGVMLIQGCSRPAPEEPGVQEWSAAAIDFKLIDQNGRAFSTEDLAGRWAVFYFGFTSCPEICPVAMSKLEKAIALLPADERDRLQSVFISVDPERDTPVAVKAFVRAFGMEFIGLTGSAQQLKSVRDIFGAYASRQDESGESSQFDHSTAYFLVDPLGVINRRISAQGSPTDIAKSLAAAFRAGHQPST